MPRVRLALPLAADPEIAWINEEIRLQRERAEQVRQCRAARTC